MADRIFINRGTAHFIGRDIAESDAAFKSKGEIAGKNQNEDAAKIKANTNGKILNFLPCPFLFNAATSVSLSLNDIQKEQLVFPLISSSASLSLHQKAAAAALG